MSDRYDIVVVGAGASAAAAVWSLRRHGFSIVCLEQGDWLDPSAYPTTSDDWELHLRSDFAMDPNTRRLPADYPVRTDESAITPFMYNAVGGSTVHWGAQFPRFHPSDFRVRSQDGVATDWPLDYKELEPYYDLNDRMMGVAGLDGDPAYPPKSPRQTPPLPLGRFGEVVARGFDRLGWHWWPSDAAINSVEYDGRPGCNNCGPCVLGCTTRARNSVDVSYWPKALRNGVVLRTRCRVSRVLVDDHDRATGVECVNESGKRERIEASLVVVACNGIGTPRLLLNSATSSFPDGLANRSGLLGTCLMFHPAALITGLFDEDLESYKGPVGASITSHQFYETDPDRGCVRGVHFQAQRQYGPIDTALGGPGETRIPWGAEHHHAFASLMGHQAMILALVEDLPESHNRVVLDERLTDSDGNAAPRVRYTLSDNTETLLRVAVDRADEALRAAGAREVTSIPHLKQAGFHLLGTARLGTDPTASVVDPFCRSHDVPNLFVIDGSVFVTAGAVNPTPTIQALALRAADFIHRERRNLEVSR